MLGQKFPIANGDWSDDTPSVGKYSFDCVHGWDNIIMSVKADLLDAGDSAMKEIGVELTDDSVAGTRTIVVGFKPLGNTIVNIIGWDD